MNHVLFLYYAVKRKKNDKYSFTVNKDYNNFDFAVRFSNVRLVF